jgi:hypothetical protein
VNPYINGIEAALTTALSTPPAALAIEPDPRDDHLVAGALRDTLLLEEGGQYLWRMCNRHIDSGPRRLMALIEERNQQFDVTCVDDDHQWTVFPTMLDALTHVLRTHANQSRAGTNEKLA